MPWWASRPPARSAAAPSVPNIQPPKAALPKAALPKAALPKAALPKAALPKAALPKAALPKAALPKAALPRRSVGDVEEAPAGSAGLAAGGRRTIGRDSNHLPPPQGTAGAQTELAAQAITRDSTYYYVTFCNNGMASSGAGFTIKLTNTASDESFTSNALYPFAVPAAGTCATTGGFTCGLIGDPDCSQCVSVRASVDSDNSVAESDESNNDLTAKIGCTLTDLVPQKITRDSTYYYVTYCNNGGATSGSTFTIKFTNVASNESFTSNSLYPFSVPAPGTCATTGGLTCGLIGDPTCSLPIAVSAKVDPDNTVVESNELNNTMIVSF